MEPADYHIRSLLENDRYEVDGEPEATDSTVDEMLYALDGEKASVVDDLKDRDGVYDNAAAFMSNNFDDYHPFVQKISGEEAEYGFVAVHDDKEEASTVSVNGATLMDIPQEVALVFDAGDQYDIKIE